MNHIILNGIRSETINGLLIQSFPPITKPLMRTQVDVIDGRDGDIVTALGYAAYDKAMTIGLYGRYDVDDVISYFSGKGTVVFGNEPDKYYRYEIIEQIDFERLIRFRTATVTFHVQPFKYSAVERVLSKSVGGSVESVTISNTGNVYSRPKITVYGNGTVSLFVNGKQTLTLNIGDQGYITVDAAEMEAYKGDVLKNRFVAGNYDDLILRPGRNDITWTGNVTQIDFDTYSRWI